jgi:hypothetical protein
VKSFVIKCVVVFSVLSFVGGSAFAGEAANTGGNALSGGIAASMQFFKTAAQGVREDNASAPKADEKSGN